MTNLFFLIININLRIFFFCVLFLVGAREGTEHEKEKDGIDSHGTPSDPNREFRDGEFMGYSVLFSSNSVVERRVTIS